MIQKNENSSLIKNRNKSKKHPIEVHKSDLSYKLDYPKFWISGRPFKTYFFNALTMVLTEGEKYFIKSVNPFVSQIQDPSLKQEVINFQRQESNHNLEHRKLWSWLNEQGYPIETVVKLYKLWFKLFTFPLNDKLNLTATTGMEHFTAVLSHDFFQSQWAKEFPADMKELFEWHLAEEVQHKAVAFDLLRHVDGNYFLRVAGLIGGWFQLYLVMSGFIGMMMWKDREFLDKESWLDMYRFLFKEKFLIHLASSFLRYFRPGFHPWETEDYYFSEDYFRSRESRPTVSAHNVNGFKENNEKAKFA